MMQPLKIDGGSLTNQSVPRRGFILPLDRECVTV